MKTFLIVALTLVATLCCVASSAQQAPGGGGGRYDTEGVSFEYPSGWSLTDKSDKAAQHLVITQAGSTGTISVFVPRELITTPEQVIGGRNVVTKAYADDIASKLGIEEPPSWYDARCQEVGGRTAMGFRLSGPYKGAPTTAEVYAVVLGRRFVNLMHIRADKDEAPSSAAWKAVLDSLKVVPPADAAPPAEEIKEVVMGGLINGKVVKKPQPEYPGPARSARAQGTVQVQVLVDENGDVLSAQAISGHQLLRGASERAARKAKFGPTQICGRPMHLRGVITYNFVLM